jgi:hypothetical protein
LNLIRWIAPAAVFPATTNAQPLLDAVIARLPREPIAMSGDIIVRRQRGVVVRTLRFEMTLSWGTEPAEAEYVLMDAFGGELERMRVTREAGRPARFAHTVGAKRTPAPLPDLSAPILDTDMTWLDLTLSFLWWQNGIVTGADTVKGRACDVVEVPAPPEQAAQYAKVRIWIDRSLSMMLQAEGLSADGKPLRRLWVQSLKKTDDRWMLKDLEVQSFPSVHRTRLLVRDLSVGGSAPASIGE